MKRSVTAALFTALAIVLSSCAWLDKKLDDKRDWGAEQWYRAAKSELDAGNNQAAIKLYAELESKFPYGRYSQQAQLDTAYAYFKDGDAVQAVSSIDRFIKAYPNHQNLDYALYLKALANFKENLGPLATYLGGQDLADRDPKAARESFEMFRELNTRFPDSRYAADSRARMDLLVDALARHELHVARYYLRRGAWVAAAGRAQDVITRFPQSPARREALDIMVECYDRMGLTQLRDDTKKVLALNYPSDPLAQAGQDRATRWWWPW